MIHAQHVTKWFGSVRAVHAVSFKVDPGQVVGLLGPNGAGKTTTMRMITGFLPPTEGAITVAGYDTIDDSLPARRSLGYLPESAPLYPEMRVIEYLRYRARLYGVPRSERRAAISRAMTRCWLDDVARRRVGQLSKGYKQRVGLAGAMLHDPQVLILDEPTSGLDPTQIRETRSLIRELAGKRAVLVSSHILAEVEKTCDRVLIIARGELRADGTPESLLAPLRTSAPCIVEVQTASLPAARRAIEQLQVTDRIETLSGSDGPWTFLRVIAKQNGAAADPRESVSRALVAASVPFRELHRDAPSLEQLFFRIIEGDADAASTRGGSRP